MSAVNTKGAVIIGVSTMYNNFGEKIENEMPVKLYIEESKDVAFL